MHKTQTIFENNKAKLVAIVAVVIMSALQACQPFSSANENDAIVLENERLALEIGRDDGAIKGILDKGLDIHYELKGMAFECSINGDTIKALVPKPVYKNYAAIFGHDSKDFRINVLSSISTTAYCQIGPGYKMLPQEENRQFLNKWRSWATNNYKYLKVKRDLFDSPGIKPIDGNAHIIKDRGFIFLFSPEHDEKNVQASIPINRWIQLEDNPGALYQIKEVYPNEGKVLATVRYGEEFLYDMPNNSAVVLALVPAPKGSKVSQTIVADQEVQLIPAFSSIIIKDP